MFPEAVKSVNVLYIDSSNNLPSLASGAQTMRERLRNHLHNSPIEEDENMQVDQVEVSEELATEGVILECYRGSRDGTVATEHMGGTM